MYKVLLVDDEPAIREGLCTIVDWPGKGFVVAGTAANGRDAVRLHRELSPDLIVIDIRMPVMDGIQAVEAIRETDAGCRILILSGYAEFEYARRAIFHGVDGYILKPLDEEELEKELDRVSVLLDREAFRLRQAEKVAALRREELIRQLLSSEAGKKPALESELLPLLGAPSNVYQIALVELAAAPGEAQSAAIARRWAKALEASGLGFVFHAAPYIGLLLKADVSQPCRRKEMALLLLKEAALEIRFTAAAGAPVRQPALIGQSYAGALEVLKRSFHLKGEEIYSAQAFPFPVEAVSCGMPDGGQRRGDSPEKGVAAEPDVEELAQQLFYAVDIGSPAGVEETVELAARLLAGYDASEDYLKKRFACLLTTVLNKVSVTHRQEGVQDWMSLVSDIYLKSRYADMLELIRSRLSELALSLSNESSVPVMKQMTGFIRRHYSENLKLETLARIFKYNSGYLGKMFKQHTGESFNTYLDRVRIEQAIALLREGLKVHQVSDRVGYANVDYFHSKFKKYVGVSPSAYKGGQEGKALHSAPEHKPHPAEPDSR